MLSWIGSLSLANPLFLIGALAGAIPIIIHMIYTRKAPQILFSTVRFLKIAARKTARRRRIEDLLLLVFRVLLFSLLAVALAQPFFRSGGIFGANAGVNAALVLDNSMSMATEQEGRSRYARAKEITQGIIRGLPPGSAVAVLYAYTAHRRTEGPEGQPGQVSFADAFSHDIQSVYEAVSASDASAGRGDVAEALKKAYDLVAKTTGPNREIYVITDFQKVAWQGAGPKAPTDKSQKSETDGSLSEKFGDDKTKDVPVFVVNCSTGSFKNVAVSSVDIRARAAVVGAPVSVEATVINSSNQTLKDVSVALYVDKMKKAQKVLTLPAQGSQVVSFGYVFDAPGQHTGWVAAETHDSLPMDNKRDFCISISDRIPVGIVRDSESTLPFFSEDFYLIRALNPFHGADEADKGTVAVKPITHSELAKAKIDDLRILFLVNVKELTQSETDKVRAYLQNGGNVVIFPGDQVDLKAYQRLEVGDPPLLPARILKATGDPEERSRYVPLTRLDTSHPIFQPFVDVPNAAIRSIHLYRFYELQVKPGASGRILAKLGDGHPFLVEGSVGKGKVLFFCVSSGAVWSNLPVRNLFLPMIHQILYYLAGDKEQRVDRIVGNPVDLMPRITSKDLRVTVTNPLGQAEQVKPSERGNETVFVYTNTDVLGTYTWQTDEKPPQSGLFAINHDPQESDLTEFHQEELAALFHTTRVYFVSDAQHLEKAVSNLRQGFQLWNYLLLVVLGIAIVECILANKKKAPAAAPAAAVPANPK